MTETPISSRAEQVRERRKKPAKPARTASRARKVTKTPPVITRGGRVVMPTRPMAASRTRRQYNVSLGSPGAELRLPTVPTVRWSWRMASGLLVLVLLGTLYALWSLPVFRVSSAQISGLRRISERDVNLVLGLADTPMFLLQPDVMQKNLIEAFPEFSSAEVQLTWPNSISVTVIERVPVLAWTAGGQTVWVDAQGMSFPVRGEGDGSSLVGVEAQGAPPAPSGAPSLSENVDLAPEASAWSRPLMSIDLVSAILLLRGFAPPDVTLLYDPEHGLGWRDPQGWQVYFGPDGSDMGERLQVYQAMVAELNEQQIFPALISVEHLHAPFYRMDQ
jgi:hypothetical protein